MTHINLAFTPLFGTTTTATTTTAPTPNQPCPRTPPPSAMNALLYAWIKDATRVELQHAVDTGNDKNGGGAATNVIPKATWWRNSSTQPPTIAPPPSPPQTSALYRSLYFGCANKRDSTASEQVRSSSTKCITSNVPEFLLCDKSSVGIGLLEEVREIWQEKSDSGKRHVLSHVLGAIGVVAMMVNPLRN